MNSLANYIFASVPFSHNTYKGTKISNFQVSIKDITQTIIDTKQKEHKIDHKDLVGLFNKIGIALTQIHDIDELLALIVDELLTIVGCDACSIYIREYEPDKLIFKIARTLSLETDNSSSSKFQNREVDFKKSSIAGFVASTGESQNIEDCYYIPENQEYKFDKKFDNDFGYRTKSMLAVPLKTNDGTILGVLQLINKFGDNGKIIPFTKEYEDIIISIASLATVSILNANFLIKNSKLLTENINLLAQHIELTESMVDALSEAMDARSPHTAGHSQRVADITLLIVDAINKEENGYFANTFFSEDEILELKHAAKLHDVGKISVPENILDKEFKLSAEKMSLIKERFHVIKWYLKSKNIKDFTLLDKDFDFLEKINKAEFISDEDVNRLEEIHKKEYCDINSNIKTYITKEELDLLSIRRGNLSPDEKNTMNMHIVYSQNILKHIKFPSSMRNIPEYSGDHHEKLNGQGHPNKKKGDEISLQARIIRIADVFEALTAFDRPYKKPTPLEIVLKILNEEVEKGAIDKNLVELFLDKKLYEKYNIS